MNLLTIKNLTKAYTDKVLFDGIDFSVEEGEKVGVIGINGTGKSTLLRIIAGIEEGDSGEYTKGNHVVINYLPQNPEFEKGQTILEYVMGQNQLNGVKYEGDSLADDYGVEGEAKNILTRLGFTDFNQSIDNLSGGQKKKVALAAVLLSKNEILILDEPTNHLDHNMTEWLEGWLKSYRGTLIMITHDRYFLDLVCNRIVELDKGKLYSYKTNYEGFLELKAQREEMALSTQAKHQNILRKEIAWIQRGARARSTKQKAHIKRYEMLRDEEKVQLDSQVEIGSFSSRLGNKTIEIENLSISFEGQPFITNFTYNFLKKDRIGILGPNGCGKTTLLKIIMGEYRPDAGKIEIGETVNIGYYAQEAQGMDPKQRVIDYIRDTAEYIKTEDGGYISASQMLEKFLFTGSLQYQLIEKLSGGEKRRLYLAKILMGAPNVLILDEPTNDLDISTLCILEDYLDTFPGILITVSHDRYFLDRVVDHMLVFEGDSKISLFNGSYQEYYETYGNQLMGESAGASENRKLVDGGETLSGAEIYKQQKEKNKKRKMTYNEQREYETIEDDIAALEDKLAQLAEALADPKISSDFVKLSELGKSKEEAEAQLDEKLERYVYLEELAH
ncbi:MAG: ABC-F family ATP-binding cassette domain-containing protein [Lachnospiraceae bacterium]|nr:ABC-F family ATP-binding cassette domain-containing protein [Lachnospiraceae bacterium]MDY4793168.1 ABC-F family ATP-binding cassette domain-containing protein [Pararoseburia sp.]